VELTALTLEHSMNAGLSLIFLSGQSSRRTSRSSRNKELKRLHQEVKWLFLLIW
jgi:hypothetical protein